MRGGARVREVLGFVTLLWNHPFLTGMLILIFTPPFFPLVVYFSPLLMSTALCVVALVSVGSQMEKIKAEGGPGQLENHLSQDQGISTWMPRDGSGTESMGHHYGHCDNHHRNLYANINVVSVTPSWTGGSVGGATTTRVSVPSCPELVESNPPTPAAVESDDDWWDKWVVEYESRPGWGEQEDLTSTTPVIQTTTRSLPPAAALTPASIAGREESSEYVSSVSLVKQTRPEIRDEKSPTASVTAPVVAHNTASASALVVHREESSRSPSPPPPSTSTSGSQEEVVVVLKESVMQPYISFAPIRTGREKQVDRICPPMHTVSTNSVVVERVSDVQALQSIEKLLCAEMGGSTPPISLPRNIGSAADVKSVGLENSSVPRPQVNLLKEAMSPQLNAKGSVLSSKGHPVGASEKNRNKIAVGGSPDIAGETPLLRHLKTSRTEKQSGTSCGFSPLVLRTSRGLMSEKVSPPPQFSPRLLQSLQTLPPKVFSPRLPNSSVVPLKNSVEKIPQWVYDGIPKETTESQVKQAENVEEKHVMACRQAVKVFSYPRRRTYARRPSPIQVNDEDFQPRSFNLNTPNKPNINLDESVVLAKTLKDTASEQSPEVSSQMPDARADLACEAVTIKKSINADPPLHRILEDFATKRTHGNDDSHERTKEDSIGKAALLISTAPTAFSPRRTPLEAAVGAASSDVGSATISPLKASVVASLRTCSPTTTSFREATMTASPRQASVAGSPTPASRASSPRRPSVPSSPSIPHSRRRRHGSKYASDKLALTSPNLRDEVSSYYDAPPAAAAEKKETIVAESAEKRFEEYIPTEEELSSLPNVECKDLRDLNIEAYSISIPSPVDGALQWGRNLSARRSSPSRKSRRRLEPRRVVTSQDTDRYSLKKSLSLKIVDSTSDDERETVTPRASRRLGRTIKPLVWRSRSMTNREDSD